MALSVGTAFVDVLPNMAGFSTAVAAQTKGLGSTLSRVGGTLTKGLTIPILAAAGASTKMAMDFNKAFVQIQTLGGKTGQSMEQLKSQVLNLAQATGQDPQGLANALYLVSSAGKEAAANAMPILTQAAKGAALGMGDVETITKVLTGTTNAYGAENLSAAHAMDILTQATKDSSAEADQMAAALGPVIGIASQVGISFDQVAAALASASNQGVSTERAATGLRFLIQSLSAPTAIASQKLDQFGISAQDLQRMVSNEGLQGTLQTLADTFDLTSTRGQQAWKAVVGGARGAIVANTLVGKHAAEAADEVARLGDVAGVTNEKFKIWGETVTGKSAKALASLKTGAIRLGEALIPIFAKIVDVLSGWLDWFNKLSPAMRDNIVKWGLIVAAVGPVLKIVGSGIAIFGRLAGAIRGAAVAQTAFAASSGAATQTVAGLQLPVVGASQSMTGLGTATTTTGSALTTIGPMIVAAGGFLLAFKGYADKAKRGLLDLVDTSALLSLDWQKITSQGISDFVQNLVHPEQFKAADFVKEQLTPLIDRLNEVNGTLTQHQTDAINAAVADGRFSDALQIVRGAITAQQKATDRTNWGAWIDGAMHSAKAERLWGNWLKNGSGLTQEQTIRVARLTDSLYKYGGSLNKSQTEALRSAIATGNYSKAVGILNAAINKLPDKKQTKIEADTSQALHDIGAYVAQLHNLDGTTVHTNIVQGIVQVGRPAGGFATGVHDFAGGMAVVGEKGPELVALPRGSDVIPNNHVRTFKNLEHLQRPQEHRTGKVKLSGQLTLTPDGHAFVQGVIDEDHAHDARMQRSRR